MRATLSSKLVVPADVLLQDMAGESVLLDLKSERYFGLDEVGTFLFNTLRDRGTVQAAFDAAAAEYDVEPATLEADLLSLVERLIENGLVEIVT